jgi:hypothetical protein
MMVAGRNTNQLRSYQLNSDCFLVRMYFSLHPANFSSLYFQGRTMDSSGSLMLHSAGMLAASLSIILPADFLKHHEYTTI